MLRGLPKIGGHRPPLQECEQNPMLILIDGSSSFMSESATHVDHEKLSLLLDKARQIAGESEDERNPDAQRSTSNAQRPTSNVQHPLWPQCRGRAFPRRWLTHMLPQIWNSIVSQLTHVLPPFETRSFPSSLAAVGKTIQESSRRLAAVANRPAACAPQSA